jgi:hypothetical protein
LKLPWRFPEKVQVMAYPVVIDLDKRDNANHKNDDTNREKIVLQVDLPESDRRI